MRYLSLVVVVSLFVFAFITNSFAQSSETESLKNKVDMLEKELQEIKDLLKHQIERDVQKEKDITCATNSRAGDRGWTKCGRGAFFGQARG